MRRSSVGRVAYASNVAAVTMVALQNPLQLRLIDEYKL